MIPIEPNIQYRYQRRGKKKPTHAEEIKDNSVNSQGPHLLDTDSTKLSLVQHGEHLDDVLVLILADELRQGTDVVERPLGVGDTHDSVEETDGTETTGVVPTVLRSGDGVEIEVDSDTVLSGPRDSPDENETGIN